MVKTALVTGGNTGIGFQTAKLLAEKNYQVTITGRDQAKVLSAVDELNSHSTVKHKVKYYIADMGNISELKLLSEKFESGLDALVLNAGIAKFKPLTETNEADYLETMDINTKGSYFLCQYLEAALRAKHGAISFVSSAVVNNGLRNASLYAMSKGALDAVVKSLAVELAPYIRVNAVSPGAVRTSIQEKYNLPEAELEKRIKMMEKTIPMQRYGKPEELAHVIVSQLESTYVTGAIWDVGGGIHSV